MKASVWAGVALCLALCDSDVVLGASGAITEDDAIRLFLENSPQARLVDVRAEAARSDFRIGTEVTNPAVAYQIEDAAGVRDEFLTFEQALPITGRRSLLKDGAEAAASAAGLLAKHELRDAAFSLKIAFHEALYRDAQVGIVEQALAELTRTVAALHERERAGEGSGYDVLRAEQETAELQLDIEKAKAASAEARAKLASFFDDSLAMGAAVLKGDFELPGSVWTADEAVAKALEQRSDLQALKQDARYQDLGLEAARRQRFPEPVLSAGWKRVEALGESDTGFIAALMVPIPVFDRGKYAAASARAASTRITLQTEILEREIRAEVETALARAQAARSAAVQFGPATERRAAELRRIAQLAYDEGERGILDLLDAWRTSLRMELWALSARQEARREHIQLERVMGSEVRP